MKSEIPEQAATAVAAPDPTASRQRMVEGLVLVALGLLILYFHGSGRVVHYLRENFRNYTLVGATASVLLGLFHLLMARVRVRGAVMRAVDTPLPWWAPLGVVLMPALVGTWFTVDGFSADAIQRKAMSAPVAESGAPEVAIYTRWILGEPLDQRYEITSSGAYRIPVEEIFFSGADAAVRELFGGLEVEVVAQVKEERRHNPDGRRLRLFETVITCCAADARALGFAAEFDGPAPELTPGAWVRVQGVLRYEPDGRVYHPVLAVERWDPARRPARSLLD